MSRVGQFGGDGRSSMGDRSACDGPVTRRRFLAGSALAGVSAFLAACAGTASEAPSTGGSVAVPTPAVSPTPTAASPTPKPPTGPLKWANWPAYIDLAGKAGDAGEYAAGSSPTIEEFKKQYGVDVDYEEKIEDNNDFYATIQPALVGGCPTGWDLIVLTDWMASRLISKGWVEQIDQGNVANCTANVRDALKGYPWDPQLITTTPGSRA